MQIRFVKLKFTWWWESSATIHAQMFEFGFQVSTIYYNELFPQCIMFQLFITIPNECVYTNENATPLTWMCSRLMPVFVCVLFFKWLFILDPLYSCCERGGKSGFDMDLILKKERGNKQVKKEIEIVHLTSEWNLPCESWERDWRIENRESKVRKWKERKKKTNQERERGKKQARKPNLPCE